MIEKINLSKIELFNPINFKKNKKTKEENQNLSSSNTVSIPQDTFKAYNSITFQAKKTQESKTPSEYLTSALETIRTIKPDETISINQAIKTLKPLELNDKQLLDFVLAASYNSHTKDIVVNKQAIYEAIALTEDIPKSLIPKVIAASLDNENKVFMQDKYKSMFNPSGHQLRLSVKSSLPPVRPMSGYPNARTVNMEQKAVIYQAINDNITEAPQKTTKSYEDITKIINIDLSKEKEKMIDLLESAKEESNFKLPTTLYNKILNAINNDNFNIKEICSDYYSLLKECTTLDEAKELYPEIKIPEHNFIDNGNVKLVETRLANENFDKIGLYILEKLYINQESKSNIVVPFENDAPTLYSAMEKRGIDFGGIPLDIKNLCRKGEDLKAKFKVFDQLADKDIEKYMRREAIKKSRLWAEMIGVSNKYWRPVRAIAYKQAHPTTSFYQTDKLIDGYLFNLYQTGAEVKSTNPLEQYLDGQPFNADKKATVEKIYNSYRNNQNIDINSSSFKEFKSQFDIEGMQKSLLKLEKHYKNTFAKLFVTDERRERYLNELEKAYELLFEKMDINKNKIHKIEKSEMIKEFIEKTENEVVDTIVEDENFSSETIKQEFRNIKNIILSTENQKLIDLFKMNVGSDESAIDINNFNKYKEIIEPQIIKNKIKNPEKLIDILKLNEQYEIDLFNSVIPESLTFEEYIEETKPKSQYNDLVKSSSGNASREKFIETLNSKFINEKKQYFNFAEECLEKFDQIPETFKNKLNLIALLNINKDVPEFYEEIKSILDKILSWNMDKDDIIVMDADKIPQNVVITSRVKYDILKDCKDNFDKFDVLITKFLSAAEQRIGGRHGQGVKSIVGNKDLIKKFAVELKIQGSKAIGEKRLYGRIPTAEEITKYGNVKYIFDNFAKHL